MANKPVTKKIALQKLQQFCAYQERCLQEVRTKLVGLGLFGDAQKEVIEQLEEEDFLNEARFAKAFVGGKFRLQHWGRVRISQELKKRGVAAHHLQKALAEIAENDYTRSLDELVAQKWRTLFAEPNDYIRRQKVAKFAVGRGFEMDLVWEAVERLAQSGDEDS